MLTDAERYVRQYGSDCVVMIALRGEPINSETDLATGEVLYKFPDGSVISDSTRSKDGRFPRTNREEMSRMVRAFIAQQYGTITKARNRYGMAKGHFSRICNGKGWPSKAMQREIGKWLETGNYEAV